MNLLAHAYLSFRNPEILVGNMISDFIKGKRKFEYSKGIQDGITIHRAIDTFTDDHEATKQAKEFLRPAVGLYCGAFVDVAFDHFLANDKNEFTSDSLMQCAQETYNTLESYNSILPEPFKSMLPYMKKDNWLYNYKTLLGAEKSFGGVVRRAKYLNSSNEVFKLFEKHYLELQKCYNAFFPSLKAFTIYKISLLSRS